MPVRAIDIHKCIGCGTCIESCPMDVFRLDTFVAKKREISPCSFDCPLSLDQREYHYLVNLGMLNEAADKLIQRHPMPAITGRVCPHPCETDCSRIQVDEAININGLEQYLGDFLLQRGIQPLSNQNGQKVAVIGSGPAGLSAAYFLTLSGYGVTVFEKDTKPGGILRYHVPSFRMPESVMDRQIAVYENMGITFKTNARFGQDISREELKEKGYQALIVAVGASRPIPLSVPGGDSEGIISAMSFLKEAKLGQFKQDLHTVAVIGGGSVALDAARTAIRLGAEEVNIICLERLEPGHPDYFLALDSEIEEAMEEGVIINTSLGIDSFQVADGHVTGVSCVNCLSVRDENGRFNPKYGDGIAKLIQADTVITAIGQTADPTLISPDLKSDEQGFIKVDKSTQRMENELFAAGDVVTGPSTVVEALAAGKRAALSVDRLLSGKELVDGTDSEIEKADGPPENRPIYQASRMVRQNIDVNTRVSGSDECRLPFSDRQAQLEVERCLTCGSRSSIAYMDDCQVCRLCAFYCPTDAIEITDGMLLSSLHNFTVVKLGKALRD